jgi:hypothetical protein
MEVAHESYGARRLAWGDWIGAGGRRQGAGDRPGGLSYVGRIELCSGGASSVALAQFAQSQPGPGGLVQFLEPVKGGSWTQP